MKKILLPTLALFLLQKGYAQIIPDNQTCDTKDEQSQADEPVATKPIMAVESINFDYTGGSNNPANCTDGLNFKNASGKVSTMTPIGKFMVRYDAYPKINDVLQAHNTEVNWTKRFNDFEGYLSAWTIGNGSFRVYGPEILLRNYWGPSNIMFDTGVLAGPGAEPLKWIIAGATDIDTIMNSYDEKTIQDIRVKFAYIHNSSTPAENMGPSILYAVAGFMKGQTRFIVGHGHNKFVSGNSAEQYVTTATTDLSDLFFDSDKSIMALGFIDYAMPKNSPIANAPENTSRNTWNAKILLAYDADKNIISNDNVWTVSQNSTIPDFHPWRLFETSSTGKFMIATQYTKAGDEERVKITAGARLGNSDAYAGIAPGFNYVSTPTGSLGAGGALNISAGGNFDMSSSSITVSGYADVEKHRTPELGVSLAMTPK